jgi:hypothetical protein
VSETGRREATSHASCCHWRNRIAVLISAGSSPTHAVALICAGKTVHGHWWAPLGIVGPARAAASARRTDTRVSHLVCRIQRSPVILTSSTSILAVGFLASHLEGGVLCRSFGIVDLSAAGQWWRAVSSRKLIRKHALLAHVLVVVCTIHICVFRNALFAGFPAHKRASHGACHNAGCHDEDCSRKHDPAAPFHVWDEEKNINEEGQKSNQKRWDGKN